jgi:hypothetical protein
MPTFPNVMRIFYSTHKCMSHLRIPKKAKDLEFTPHPLFFLQCLLTLQLRMEVTPERMTVVSSPPSGDKLLDSS